jgi:hypothetical protein
MTLRHGPWFTCMTSYHTEPPQNRWIQDRQNFVSLFHDDCAVILGGGNTKLQPLWSTFTVGDPNLLKHKPGDEDPNFFPPPGIRHVPTDAKLDPEKGLLDLDYGGVPCSVSVDISDPKKAKLTYRLLSPRPDRVEAHVTLLPKIGVEWKTASAESGTLSATPLKLSPGEAGKWFEHRGWRISVPSQASIQWPVLPHNPYTKDGHAEPHEGRIVMTLPFDAKTSQYEITVEVP